MRTIHEEDEDALISQDWQRLARSVWQANRAWMDVPAWLAPANSLSPSELFPEEETYPLRYGVSNLPLQSTRQASPTLDDALMADPFVVAQDEQLPPSAQSSPGPRTPILRFPRPAASMAVGRRLAAAATCLAPRAQSAAKPELVLFRPRTQQTVAVFSLHEKTGCTSIAASLARILAGNSLHTLLAEISANSSLPHFFGATAGSPGILRRFCSFHGTARQSISIVSLPDRVASSEAGLRIRQEIPHLQARHMDCILWDLSGAPLDRAADHLRRASKVLIPVVPGMHALLHVQRTEEFLGRNCSHLLLQQVRYVLTHFEAGDPCHLDIQRCLRLRLGARIFPGALRQSQLVEQALSAGRTVVDHAPSSLLVQDLHELAIRLGLLQGRPSVSLTGYPRLHWHEEPI